MADSEADSDADADADADAETDTDADPDSDRDCVDGGDQDIADTFRPSRLTLLPPDCLHAAASVFPLLFFF